MGYLSSRQRCEYVGDLICRCLININCHHVITRYYHVTTSIYYHTRVLNVMIYHRGIYSLLRSSFIGNTVATYRYNIYVQVLLR